MTGDPCTRCGRPYHDGDLGADEWGYVTNRKGEVIEALCGRCQTPAERIKIRVAVAVERRERRALIQTILDEGVREGWLYTITRPDGQTAYCAVPGTKPGPLPGGRPS
jgi:hypothetical protein